MNLPIITWLQSFPLNRLAMALHRAVHECRCVVVYNSTVRAPVVGLGTARAGRTSTVLTSSYMTRRAVSTGFSTASTYTCLTAPVTVTPAALGHDPNSLV